MPAAYQTAINYLKTNRPRFLDELIEFLKIPSISTDPNHTASMLVAAEWLAEKLNRTGLENTQIISTQGHPAVYADYLHAGPHQPTMLIYGHYDVQPPDPLDLWMTDPFSPAIIGDHIYARGSSDMKGQILASIFALESIFKNGSLPVNIKYLIEGEEEIGSPSLSALLEDNRQLLSADFSLNLDAGMAGPDLPTIVTGLRGLAYFELTVYGPRQDLHSGVYGGVVKNPAIALAEIISGMHDSSGKITLPGFYDDVIELTAEERRQFSELPEDDYFYLVQTGAPELFGEHGFSAAERIGARPTLDVNGFISGFTGLGSKTIIPSWAKAKISTRLVPNQNPVSVRQSLESYLNRHAPAGVTWELVAMAGGSPYLAPDEIPGRQALISALKSVWGKNPIFKREGGSIPVVNEMKTILGIDSLLTGFGLPDDRVHSPNERLHLPTWYKGIEALVQFLYNLSNHKD